MKTRDSKLGALCVVLGAIVLPLVQSVLLTAYSWLFDSEMRAYTSFGEDILVVAREVLIPFGLAGTVLGLLSALTITGYQHRNRRWLRRTGVCQSIVLLAVIGITASLLYQSFHMSGGQVPPQEYAASFLVNVPLQWACALCILNTLWLRRLKALARP